jgi:hypothetical protein
VGDTPLLPLASPALAGEASVGVGSPQHPDPLPKRTKQTMTPQDLQAVDIPLNKLTLWDDNVRTNGAEDGLDELIASITSVGLLHSLVVQKATRGQYSVIAGKRRFLALSQMANAGNVKRTMPVPCRVAAQGADLTEISLAENVVRESMIGCVLNLSSFPQLPQRRSDHFFC